MDNKTPRLPPQRAHGSPTTLNGMSETFAFHSSPETFIASRVLAFQAEYGNILDQRPAIHAKILNRDVAVISSYAQIRHILTLEEGDDQVSQDEAGPIFVATDAYRTFMAAFFPSPNLLLSEGPSHERMRQPWEQRMSGLASSTVQQTKYFTSEYFQSLLNQDIDLYDSMKTLIWKILLKTFLNLEDSEPSFQEIEKLQEDLLRGQFSLVPVSVNIGIWQSPRSRGIASKDRLLKMISHRLKTVQGACPFHNGREDDMNEMTNHILLFTSSLAVKGIASLLTAFLLNLYLLDRGGVRLREEVQALEPPKRARLLRSIALETERLSPPIVGIMRRANRDTVVPSAVVGSADTLIPKGWDSWLYFLGAGRDEMAFGDSANRFDPQRFIDLQDADSNQPLSFSIGPKKCLGQHLVRDICITIAETMLARVGLEGEVSAAKGVRAWLGWDGAKDVGPEEWARDMKQLPTQRPSRPVMVKVVPQSN
jgi:cytochrome P450